MMSRKILIKSFIIGILVFLLLNTSSSGAYQDKQQVSNLQGPTVTVFGALGDNHWFISNVTIIFSYDVEKVKEVQYYFDENWHIYSTPIVIEEDGEYMIQWFWVDMENNTFNGFPPISFNIDQTPPTIELSRKSSGKNTVIFTADAVDQVSQIERVEFYLDDELKQTVNELPYKYTWTGEENQVVYAIGYNYAGFDAKSNNLTTEPRTHFRNHYLMNIIFVLMQKTFFRFY